MLRSGLIVEVAAAEQLVGRWRRQLDPQADLGVPAHVTVLYPFVPPRHIDSAIIALLTDLITPLSPFEFQLVRTDWFGDRAALWLAPEPADPFRDLTNILCRSFPDYPPYGGQHDEVIPHLTVGSRGTTEQLRRAEQDIAPQLPVRATARSVILMVEQPDRRWQRHSVVPLVGR